MNSGFNNSTLKVEGAIESNESNSGPINDQIYYNGNKFQDLITQSDVISKKHTIRLEELETDNNTLIFQNLDGNNTLYYYSFPIKYLDKDGKIKDKSNKIVEIDYYEKGNHYKYTNESNDINLLFPDTLLNNSGIILDSSEIRIEMIPFDYFEYGNKINALLNTDSIKDVYLNIDSYQNEAVLYNNVFGQGTVLRYTPDYMGIKEDIILNTYEGKNKFSFLVRTNGLQIVQDSKNKLTLKDPESDNTYGSFSEIFVYDNTYSSESGGKYTFNNEYTVEHIEEFNLYKITLNVDEVFLTDENTTYPIVIDPTITIYTDGSGESKTIIDAPIYSGQANTSFGSDTTNGVGKIGGSKNVGRTLMRFPGLISNSTYSNLNYMQINSVKLNLREHSGSSGWSSVGVHAFTGTNWVENSVTYNNAIYYQHVSASVTSVGFFDVTHQWVSFNITNLAKDWKKETYDHLKGLILKNSTEVDYLCYRTFYSTEGTSTYRPRIVVDYSEAVTNAPLIQQNNYYYCGPASLLQTLYGFGKGGNVQGSTYSQKQTTLATQLNTTTSGTYVYMMRDVANSYNPPLSYSYHLGSQKSSIQFKEMSIYSLLNQSSVILHAKTEFLGYYEGHVSGHYICLTKIFGDEATLKDCNNNANFYGTRTVPLSEVYNSISSSGRYFICGG